MFNIIFALAAWVYQGFAIKTVWNWFPSEIFHLPQLTIVTALGLQLTLTLFKGAKKNKSVDDHETTLQIIYFLSFTSIGLIFGYIIHTFM